MLSAFSITALTATCLCAMDAPLDLDAVRHSYQQKMERLKTYIMEYEATQYSITPAGKLKSKETELYAHYSDGPLFGIRAYQPNPSNQEAQLQWRQTFDGGMLEEWDYSGSTQPQYSSQFTDPREAYAYNRNSALAMMGLQSTALHMLYPMQEVEESNMGMDVLAILDDPRLYIKPEQEIVRGYRCNVLTLENKCTVWLAPELDFALVQRETYDNGSCVCRVTCDAFVELAPSLFTPKEIRTEKYETSETSSDKVYSLEQYAIRCMDLGRAIENDEFHLGKPKETPSRMSLAGIGGQSGVALAGGFALGVLLLCTKIKKTPLGRYKA